MTDAEYLFRTDIREKKRTGSGAFHKKNGSKSKGCRLPHDHLSKKGKEKMNGPVSEIKMNKPFHNWKAFRSLPVSMQNEYICGLVDNYGARCIDIAEMFGVSKQNAQIVFSRYPNKPHFKRGGNPKVTQQMDDRFLEFLTAPEEKEVKRVEKLVAVPPKVGEEKKFQTVVEDLGVIEDPVDPIVKVVPDIIVPVEVAETVVEEPKVEEVKANPIVSCTMQLSGSPEEIFQVLSMLMPEGASYSVDISLRKAAS